MLPQVRRERGWIAENSWVTKARGSLYVSTIINLDDTLWWIFWVKVRGWFTFQIKLELTPMTRVNKKNRKARQYAMKFHREEKEEDRKKNVLLCISFNKVPSKCFSVDSTPRWNLCILNIRYSQFFVLSSYAHTRSSIPIRNFIYLIIFFSLFLQSISKSHLLLLLKFLSLAAFFISYPFPSLIIFALVAFKYATTVKTYVTRTDVSSSRNLANCFCLRTHATR